MIEHMPGNRVHGMTRAKPSAHNVARQHMTMRAVADGIAPPVKSVTVPSGNNDNFMDSMPEWLTMISPGIGIVGTTQDGQLSMFTEIPSRQEHWSTNSKSKHSVDRAPSCQNQPLRSKPCKNPAEWKLPQQQYWRKSPSPMKMAPSC